MLKKFLLLSCAFCLFPLLVEAQTIKTCSLVTPCTFTWERNIETDMKEYRVYVSQVSQAYPTSPAKVIQHPATSTALGILDQGMYFVVVRAVDQAGNESGNSNELTFFYDAPPLAPVIQFSVSIP